MSSNAPCKNCAERHIGCHSTCVKYATFLQNSQKRKEQKKEHRQKLDEYIRDGQRRRMKRFHIKGCK